MYPNEQQSYFKVGYALAKKWQPLLEGIEGEYNIINAAILLENESQHGTALISESTSSGVGTQASPNIAQFQHYLLPLVRRVYPNLIINDLVGVQPMTSPASLVFYLKYRYQGLVNSMNAPAGGGPLTTQQNPKGSTAAGTQYGNFIGDTWSIDPYYSLQTVRRESLGAFAAAAAGATVGGAGGIALAANPYISVSGEVYFLIANGATYAAAANVDLIKLSGMPSSAAPSTAGVTLTLIATLKGAATGASVAVDLSDASVTPATNKLVVTVAGGSGLTILASTQAVNASAAQQLYLNTVTYDFNMEDNRQLPEIDLYVESSPVTARTRKLRTKWTIEAAQDLRAMHNIDAEKELVALLGNEIAAEIDREVLNALITNAGIRTIYDYSNPFVVGGFVSNANAVSGPVATGTALGAAPVINIVGSGNFDDRNRALMYQIIEASNQIYRQSLRGSGNWVVTSPEIASKLESLREWLPDAASGFTYNLGIQLSGTLNGQFKMYKDPLFPKDLVLIGFKGSSFMDAGFFYCPYVPLQMTPTVLDPETFNPRKGLMTRYGTVFVENGPRMYAVIKVNNLTAVGSGGITNVGLDGNGISSQIQGRSVIDGSGDDLI